MCQFKWPLCKKKYSVGFSMTKAGCGREQDLRRYKRLKAVLRSGMTSLQVIVASARNTSCWSNEAVTLLYLVP